MTWQLASTEAISGKGAKTIGKSIHARDEDLYEYGTSWFFDAVTISSAGSWQDIDARYIRIPGFGVQNMVAYVKVGAVDDGTYAHQLRINTSGDTGSTITMGTTGAHAIYELDVTISAASPAGTYETFTIQGYKHASAGTDLVVDCEAIALNFYWSAS